MERAALIVGSHVPGCFRARATAVSDRAVYVGQRDRVIAVLLAEGTPPAPHGVVVSGLPARLGEVVPHGSRVVREREDLTVVTPAAGRRGLRWTLAGVPRFEGSVVGGHAAARARWPRGGAVVAVSSALARHEHEYESGSGHRGYLLSDRARDRVRTLLADLVLAARAGDDADVERVVEGMVGLGPGSTPSGDDALVGFLAARWAVTGEGGAAARAALRSAPRTGAVSRSFLELAARGAFCEPLASLARALADGRAEDATRLARACLGHGATSGADGVAGLLGGYGSMHAEPSAIQQGA